MGGNFPCHGVKLTDGPVTNLAVGQSVPLQFELGGGANTAVHGGGSCQISLTYETDPAALKNPSSWHVIKSYVGGCPTDAKGNLNTAVMCPNGYPECVNALDFTVPPEVQNGNAILAFTWFNNVGNREMYMNCAKVSVSGGQNQLSQLPNMLVANINNGCSSTEGFNIDFPDPGKYVQKEATLNYPLKAPVGSGCPTGPGSAGSNQVAQGNPPAASSAAAPLAAATVQAGGSGISAPPRANPVPTTLATSAANPPAAPSAANPPPAAPPAADTASAASPAGTAASGNCPTGQVACTAQGFYCIDTTTYGECAFGCATPMQMAGGTQCMNNAVSYAVDYPGPPAGMRVRRREVRRRL
jgi:hypothetical protein